MSVHHGPPQWLPCPSLCPPDMLVCPASGSGRAVHRVILSRLSASLEQLLVLCHDQEEQVCLLLPDVSASTLDTAISLAYRGAVAGLSQQEVHDMRELCGVLKIRQEEFIIRAEQEAEVRVGQGQEQDVGNREQEKELVEKSREQVEVGREKELRDVVQGCFRCRLCEKTFIYVKSFERHTSECHVGEGSQEAGGSGSPGEGGRVEEPRKSSRKKTPAKGIEEQQESGKPQRDLFKFVHFEQADSLCFCRFPGCRYHEANPGFKTLGGCKNHQLLQHATEYEKIFPCKFCDKTFASNQLRNKHENLAHVKRFPCESCKKVFSEKTRLLIHSRIHSGEKPYVCEDCGFSCAQKDNLRLHKQFKHPSLSGQEKKFVCLVCSASFLTKSNLSRHSISHTDLKQCVCETCGKAFKDPGALRQHTFSHSETDFPCDKCDQRFASPLYLNRHMGRKHPTDGVQPLTCGLCGRGFPLNHQLQQHIEAVHHQVKHCCPHCDQAIGRRSSVHRHIKKGRCRGQARGQQHYLVQEQEHFLLQEQEDLEVGLGGQLSPLVLPLPPLSSLT